MDWNEAIEIICTTIMGVAFFYYLYKIAKD